MGLLTQFLILISLVSYGLSGGVGPSAGSRPFGGVGGVTPGLSGSRIAQFPIGPGAIGGGLIAPGVQGVQSGIGGVSGSGISQVPFGQGIIGGRSPVSGLQGIQTGFGGVQGVGVSQVPFGQGIIGGRSIGSGVQGVQSGFGGVPGVSGFGIAQVPGGVGARGIVTPQGVPGVLGGVGGGLVVPGGLGRPIVPGAVGTAAMSRGIGGVTGTVGGVTGGFPGVAGGLGGVGGRSVTPGGVGTIGGISPVSNFGGVFTGQEVNAYPEPYTMGYQNQDELGNVDFRSEQGDAYGNVQGSYGYSDIQGLYRRVEYSSGADGFRAVVHTNEPGTEAGNPAGVHMNVQPSPYGVQERYTPVTGVAGTVTGAPLFGGLTGNFGTGVGPAAVRPGTGIGGASFIPTGSIGSTGRPTGVQFPTGVVGSNNFGTTLGGGSVPPGVGFPGLAARGVQRGGAGVRSGKSGY